MDEVANVSPRRRKVRCPNCHGVLSEPGSPIYECPFCSILLQAKGIPPDFQGESLQMPVNENNQNSQQTNEPEAKSFDGNERIRSQRQVQLNDHETNEHMSIDGNIRCQEQLSEIVSVVENRSEQELQLENDVGNGSTSVGDIDMSADYTSKISTAIGMAVDCGKDCGESPETQSLLDHTISQLPLEDAESCGMQTASEEKKEFVGECECDTAGEGNEQIFQSEIIRDNESQETQLLLDHTISHLPLEDAESCGMASGSEEKKEFVGERECDTAREGNGQIFQSKLIMDNESQETQLLLDHTISHLPLEDAENCGMPSASEEKRGECECDTAEGNEQIFHSEIIRDNESQETQLLLDHTISHLPLEDAENCSMPSASEEKKEFVDECECDIAGEGNEQNFQSEIIRDNDHDLSFKYISSVLESNDQLSPKKRTSRSNKLSSEASVRVSKMSSKPSDAHLTEMCPLSSDENSDYYESYSSASESASLDNLDSEFDFPSPSAESMQPPNLSDLLFQRKLPLPDVHCDAPATPHQLEWQAVDHEKEEIALQNSNGAIALSVEVNAKIASDVLNGVVEQGDQVERIEVEWYLQREDPIKKETFLAGLEDTVRGSLHVQRENAQLSEGLANIVGSVDSKEGDSAERKEDYSGYQGSLAYQVNNHKSMLNNDLQEGVSGSLDLSSSGAEHASKLKSGSTLKEKVTNASTVIVGTEPPLCSLSDGSKSETCLATQENIKLIRSVANVKLEDSVATIASENTVITGRASQSKIASQMNFVEKVEKIQERSSDPLHSQQNMLLQDANNQNRRASRSSDMSAKRDVESVYSAQNKALESVGVQSFPFVSELFDSRLHHKRSYSEETRVQSELSNKYTSQVQKNVHNEGLYMSRSTRGLEGSNKVHQRNAQAAFELSDGQGPWLQKQNHQADMHMQHGMEYSGPTNDAYGFYPGSLQPSASAYHSNGSDSFARGVPNTSLAFSYQAPSHPWMLPVMPGMHYGCHSVAPVCTACIHCQHSHLPQLPMPPCGLCFNQPLALAHQRGHTDLCNCHQGHQIQASDQGASMAHCSPTYFSPQTLHTSDTAMAMGKPLVSSGRKPKHYPPLPRGSTAPYIICKGCDEILEVPTDIPLSDKAAQKLRCGACYKVAKFSVFQDNQGTCNAALESATTNEASTSTSYAMQYTEHSRQPPVSIVVQSMDSSYHQGIYSVLHRPQKQGSFDSQQQISAASKRRGSRPSSLDEIVQSTQCEADQDEFFFRSLSRHSEFDSSRIFFNGFKASSSAIGANGLVMALQAPVDEKEEGLDFGAPRMSDGESLDQRSPESRMRSPENKQHFQLLAQRRHIKDSLEEEACWTTENMEQQALDLKRKMIAEGKKPSTSLFALLNQESSKFEINLEERVSFDEARSVLCSTASSSPMDDDHTNERSNVGDNSTSQPWKLSSNHFVRKGPRYVAGVLRKGLRDFRRGSQ